MRRLDLYDRLGARVLGVPFVQPSLGEGRKRVPGLLLLAFHVSPDLELPLNDGTGIPSEIVARFVRRYYETTEGPPDRDDKQLSELLRRIEEKPTIPLLPIDEYEHVEPLPETFAPVGDVVREGSGSAG
jgi:hypothetical protein